MQGLFKLIAVPHVFIAIYEMDMYRKNPPLLKSVGVGKKLLWKRKISLVVISDIQIYIFFLNNFLN